MTPHSLAILERLLRDNDLGWMIDTYAPREQAVPNLLDLLERLAIAFRGKLNRDVSFAPEILHAESKRSPHKVRAFLQALGISGSLEMLLMVWRMLQGLNIHEVAMHYREREEFSLSVTLANPESQQVELEMYSTSDINDAALLRHFGVTTLDKRPLFDGFFPLKK
jgi:hypothetical protein